MCVAVATASSAHIAFYCRFLRFKSRQSELVADGCVVEDFTENVASF